MARVRFTPHHEETPTPLVRRIGRRTEPVIVEAQTTKPGNTSQLPPMLPLGYTDAATLARRYTHSYTRLSRSMRNTYGPIPREIPQEYLRNLAPRTAITGPIIEDGPTSPTSETTSTPSADRHGRKTLLTAICVILAVVIVGSWAGSVFVTTTTTATVAPISIAPEVPVRLDQSDPQQYASTAEYNLWWPSACSPSAMAEVINAYGHNYHITNILHEEIRQNQITPKLGMLYGASSIQKTVAAFGFKAESVGTDPTIDDVLAVANGGRPVIIGFPPQTWAGGHVLVLRGGNARYIYLTDSSKLDMQTMDRQKFLQYWRGFAVVVTPIDSVSSASGYSVLGPPSISADLINQVLAYYHSPAAGKGQEMYDLGVKYGVDPVFALAFFMNESTFGTAGEAAATLALGNERCISDRPCIDQDRGGYAQFYSWEDGFEHWYMLIIGPLYKGANLTTVDTIIPRYAPNSDQNNEAHYIAVVKLAVDTWRTGKLVIA